MSQQKQIVERLIAICFENDLFLNPNEIIGGDGIGDFNLLECPSFDSLALVFLQSEIEDEWGVHIAETQFAAWLRTLNQIADYIAQHQAERAPAGGQASCLTKSEEIV